MKKLSLLTSFIFLMASGLALLGIAIVAMLFTLPDVHQLEKCFTTSMYEVYLCASSENYVKLKQISPYAIHAVIAAEDGGFYSHEGFDWHEMEESLSANLKSGKIQRGGSTLTQQLAKNIFLGKEKSLWRKLKKLPAVHLSEEEQAYLNGLLEPMCSMLNDGDITHKHRDLPPELGIPDPDVRVSEGA